MDNPFDSLGTNSKSKQPLPHEEKEQIKSLALKGLGVNEIAREMKRSASTVSRVLKEMKISNVVTVAKAGRILDEKLNAAEQLKKINKRANTILDKLKMETAETAEKYGLLVLKACEAIRRDLELQLKICEALYNVEEVAKWQNEVMDILGEVAPDARDRFYQRMQERRPL
jgi:transposase